MHIIDHAGCSGIQGLEAATYLAPEGVFWRKVDGLKVSWN
jgi:hypothetical protein